MRSDSDRNKSASLTRITRQVSRTFDLNLRFEEKIVCEVEYVIDFQIWGSYNFTYGK